MTAIAILGLATTTSAQVPSYVPTSGLISWWPFNGNANDESTYTNDGSVNSATLTIDRFGNANKAYSFDGGDDYIDIPHDSIFDFGTNINFSFSFWLNTSTYHNISGIISKETTSIPGIGYQVMILENKPRFDFMSNGPNDIDFRGDTTINNGSWHHIVLTANRSNNTISFYLDGVINSSLVDQNLSIGNVSNPSSLKIGVERSYGNHFNGKLDDIGIWNRALTEQEITDLYNSCELSIKSQPTSQTINISNKTQFIVGASDPNATYRWQTDLGVGFQNLNSVGQYSGTTNDTLTILNVTMSNNNQPFRCIISSGDCLDTSNVAVLTVNNNVGINENSQDNLFSVFPNPAKSQINVKADAKLLGSIYTVYDNTGKLVLTGKINSENTVIELGNLSGGIYLFSVGENLKQTFKVIKE